MPAAPTEPPAATSPASSSARGLQHTVLARKDDAGERSLSQALKSGTELAVDPATILGSSCAFLETMHEQDPATGDAWTPAAVDAVQAGLEVAP
jgi:hypothetical protein